MVRLTLSNGQTIENLSQNGNNFISSSRIDESIFNGNLDTLTIEDTETGDVYVMYSAELVQQVHYSDGWYLHFRELTEAELIQINNDMAITDLYEMILGGF